MSARTLGQIPSAAAALGLVSREETAILALDLSLCRTGWAAAGASGVLVPPKGHEAGLSRVAWLRDYVLRLAAGASVVVIEGLAFGAKGRAVLDLAGLRAIVRLALREAGIPFADVPPSVLKKYATGRGNAPKPEMLAAAIRRLDYAGHDDNIVDALWLRQAALAHYCPADAVELPAVQRAALSAITWPHPRSLTLGGTP